VSDDDPLDRLETHASQMATQITYEQQNRRGLLWVHSIIGITAGVQMLLWGSATTIETALGIWSRALMAGLGFTGGLLLAIGLSRRPRSIPLETAGLVLVGIWDLLMTIGLAFARIKQHDFHVIPLSEHPAQRVRGRLPGHRLRGSARPDLHPPLHPAQAAAEKVMDMSNLAVLGAVVLGSGGLGGIIVAFMKRGVDSSTVRQNDANSHKTEVETLREIIAEVRASEARKDSRIDALEGRLDKLEERERHMLTRAAVHEAWDTLAYNFISGTGNGTSFPPPPPLSTP
jgi:hypothetical protein